MSTRAWRFAQDLGCHASALDHRRRGGSIQFSIVSPLTRSNSEVLFVTSVLM
jgi:hypothetical protein